MRFCDNVYNCKNYLLNIVFRPKTFWTDHKLTVVKLETGVYDLDEPDLPVIYDYYNYEKRNVYDKY